MKLNSMQIERTLNQFDAHVISDDHPAIAQLTRAFGQHTFFLNDKGPPEPTGVVISLKETHH
jgi:hypothetical protein